MKGYLYSQDNSYAFPLGPKVTTIGRENCDISINSPHVDNQHALIEYDNDQRCFILKDLNSSSGTYVHDCRVQNAAVRLADQDFIRFGFNGLPLQFRIEQTQIDSIMPPIYQRQTGSNTLQLITQTIPSRRATTGLINHQQQQISPPQQIDVRLNPGFSLRNRPLSAGSKKPPTLPTMNSISNPTQDAFVHPNAWTITATTNSGRSIINGSFSGEVDISGQDNTEIVNRVEQLEKEVKGRDVQIQGLNDKLRSFEPLNSTFTNEVQLLKTELDKVRREKQSASGLVSSLKRDLSSKESDIAKLAREMEGLKIDSRDKDLRLQSLQSKLNLLRDRTRAEEDRHNKEKEQKIKANEGQIVELNESLTRLKSQLQDTEKQILRYQQNEQKLKIECEHTRAQLNQIQQNENTLKTDLTNSQKKYNQFCVNLWNCFTDNDEYNENEEQILEQIREIQQDCQQTKQSLEQQSQKYLSTNQSLENTFNQLSDLIKTTIHQQTNQTILVNTQQQINDIQFEEEQENLFEIFKQTILYFIETNLQLISQLNQLNLKENDQQLSMEEYFNLIRQQFGEFHREKQNLSLEQISREQTYQTELEQIASEKDTFWQERLDRECARLTDEMNQLKNQFDEQSTLLNQKLDLATSENTDFVQKWNSFETESTQRVDELNDQLRNYQQQLNQSEEEKQQLIDLNQQQNDKFSQSEKEKDSTIEDLHGQIQVYKDQVQQFSMTIIQLEKTLEDQQGKFQQLQTDFDNLKQNVNESKDVEQVVPVIPVLTAPIADLSQELFTYKSRVQEQEQIIISLRRDLSGMTARLSDIQGELTQQQKQSLEKSQMTINEQNKELNETRIKLSKLSDIVDQQSTQIKNLQEDLTKSKVLCDEYQLLVNQREKDINRLTKSLEEKNIVVQQVEKTTQDEGRIASELVAIGAQCKGERHEQTISRQREALNDLRGRIRTLEQLRPANPSYEKVLQQVVLLKRELAELRARQALPTDISHLTTLSQSNQFQPQSNNPSRQSPPSTIPSEHFQDTQEKINQVETLNSLQSCDDLHNNFTRKLIEILDIDDDSLINQTPLANLPPNDRFAAFQQRQKTTEILIQKIQMLRERLTRKEELLRDYEKDLSKLRQAEILLREKEILLQDLETDKRTKDDETYFLRSTLKETQDNLNQEKRMNSSIKLGRTVDSNQSNELIRRSGSSTGALHHHCPPDSSFRTKNLKRDLNDKLTRKDYENKTLKQELSQALQTVSDLSHQVKLLQFQTKETTNGNSNARTVEN